VRVFAGIVERTGSIIRCGPSSAARGTGALRLEIDTGELLLDSPLGASVAVNGVCLTLADRRATIAAFDVIPETLRLTNLGVLQPGDDVNLERSLRVGDRIDGHFVQGHVDGAGIVRHNGSRDGEWTLAVELPPALLPFCVRKGSITIDGTSLTLVDVDPPLVSVALIPSTLERTVLGRRKPGDRVNIETDVLARLVVSRLDALIADGAIPPGITLDRLREAGFVP
jgi:riboflavin synthase